MADVWEQLFPRHFPETLRTIHSDISPRRQRNDEVLPSSVEEGMLWPKAMAGVVRPERVRTTPRWL
jgi:hypothetical protein